MKTNNRIQKLLLIISLLFLLLAIIIIRITPPAEGYEISIYDVYPLYFWLLLILSIVIGQIIIILNIFNDNHKKNNLWLVGLIIILIGTCIIVLLPYSRGYITYGRGDHLTHIGATKDILFTGSTKLSNYYPNLHILTAVISIIGDIDVIDASSFLPLLFPFFCFFGFIILSRYFLEKQDEFIISIVFLSSFLFFGGNSTYLAQYNQSFLLLPLVLFLYFKRSRISNTISFDILFLILSISLVFFHPLTFLLFLMILLVCTVSVYIYSKNKKNNQILTNINPEKKKVIIPILLLTIIFIAWYFSFSSIINSFADVFSSIFYGTGESLLETQLSKVSEYNVLPFDLLRIGFFTYGRAIVVGILSLFSIFYLYYHWFWKKDNHVSQYKILFLSSCIFLFIGLAFFSYIFDFIVGWGRFFLYVSFFSVIFVSIALALYLKPRQKSLNKTISYRKLSIICVIIFLILCLSVFTFYFSPLITEPNHAVLSGECIGFSWFINNRNITYLTDQLGSSQHRFYAALHQNDSIAINLRSRDRSLPDHFGYNQSIHLGHQYNAPNYLILSTLGKIVFPSMYPNYKDYWIFTEKDFAMLLDDPTVIRMYSNSEFCVFLINPG